LDNQTLPGAKLSFPRLLDNWKMRCDGDFYRLGGLVALSTADFLDGFDVL